MAIQGLESYDAPDSILHEGHLPLPVEFDRTQFAGKWVFEGPNVEKAKSSEVIPSARMRAAGWSVWLDPKTKKECKRALNKTACILMFRPKELQKAINKLYANASRRRLIDELDGASTTRAMAGGSGLLDKEQLDRVGDRERDEDEGVFLTLHHVDLEEETTLRTN